MQFLIFSLPRCGSTTLTRALNCYPGISCALEPFIPEYLGERYGSIIAVKPRSTTITSESSGAVVARNIGTSSRQSPCARVAHFFRPRFPYAVNAFDVLHNRLRIARRCTVERYRLINSFAMLGIIEELPEVVPL